MNIPCIIPARGESKRLPGKNLLLLAGKRLLVHSIEHAKQSSLTQRVIVSTDDREIASIASFHGAEVVWRPTELATDTASSESAISHVLKHLEKTEQWKPDLILFLQCTSPIRKKGDIDRAVQKCVDEGADSLFSACRNDKFVWRREKEELRSLNYDYRARPREQDFPEEYRENGSIYVFKPWVLRDLNNRLGGKVAVYEMDYWSSFQIDSREDLELCEWILRRLKQREQTRHFPRPVKIVIFDFDGVFTDNQVLFSQDGTESVWCSRADSLGISRLKERGVPVLVMSTETSLVVSSRCRKLGIECYQGINDKRAALKDILAGRGIDPSYAVYVGNDFNDLQCMRLVGCGVAVADAAPETIDVARVVLASKGGRGAVREVCEMVLDSLSENS